MALRPVSAGQKLRLRADDWNEVIRAVRQTRDARFGEFSENSLFHQPQTLVQITNGTGLRYPPIQSLVFLTLFILPPRTSTSSKTKLSSGVCNRPKRTVGTSWYSPNR